MRETAQSLTWSRLSPLQPIGYVKMQFQHIIGLHKDSWRVYLLADFFKLTRSSRMPFAIQNR